MSVRQYIGARYVTKIYVNSLDPSSAEWEANVNYEPLTLVTFNNGSFLSKKEVPSSIGDPANNPTYWVQTGFYNGQIANLQNQIDTINLTITSILSDINDINDEIEKPLKNKQIAVYGDSWSDPNLAYHAWVDVLDAATETTAHVVASGGAKFSDIDTSWDNFVADIYIIFGGINDCLYQVPLSATTSAIDSLVGKMRTANADAEIFIVTPAKQLNPTNSALALYQLPFELYRQMIWHEAIKNNIKVISGLKSTPFTMYTAADGVHPSTGSANLALVGEWILEGILRNGDSRDCYAEIVARDADHQIWQDGSNTWFKWSNGTLVSNYARYQAFPASFGFPNGNPQYVNFYNSGGYKNDLLCFFESATGDLVKRSLSVSDGALVGIHEYCIMFDQCR